MRSRTPFSWLWLAGLHFLWAQGNFGIGTTTPTERLDVEGGRLRVRAYSGIGTRLATVDPNGVFGTLSGNNPGEVLQWNGSAWVPTTISVSGDNWGSQTAVTASPIQGNGTAGSPITFQPGTAAGQTWVWNGAAWTLGTPPGDNWGTQTAVTSGPIQGNGTAGNPITFQPGTAAGQTWVWNGAAWTLGTPPGDNWGTQTAVTSGPIQGNGTAGNPITFQPGTAAGQTWVWNGAAWTLGTPPGDNWGTQTAVTSGPIQGNGTAGDPITLQPGTAPGQLLVWTGAAWTTSTPAVRNGLSFVLAPTPAIELGGSLIKNTDIDLADYVLTASGNGRVGIGLTNPSASSKVHIQNTDITGGPGVLIEQRNTGATHGLSVSTNSSTTGTAAIRGEHLNTTDGVYGVAGTVSSTSTSSAGVFGQSTGQGIGVYGQATGANGIGVYGFTNQATGIGVQGVNTNANGPAGLFVNTAAAGAGGGDGVIGITQQRGANGVFAYTENPLSIGALWAVNGAPAGTNPGLGAVILSRQRGSSALMVNLRNDALLQVTPFPNTVIGAYHMGGVSGANAPAGIVAEVASADNNARAIIGQHTNNTRNVNAYSVYGYMDRGAASIGANWAVGVYGYNPYDGANDWAVYSNGWFAASAGKGFFIDHPLDPENKYLLHATVEGPEPYNLYRGVVTTDASGRAVVHLPDYFEAANKDFSYYLQPIGTFAQVIVEEEVRNNEFVIRTDKPNVKVSWMVVATRNDPYMRYFWKPTVIEKSPEQRGKYLIPQVYGKDDSYGIFPGPVPSVESPERSIPALPKNPEIKTPKSEK